MSEYEKDRADLLNDLLKLKSKYALSYDVSEAVRRLIQELQAEDEEW